MRDNQWISQISLQECSLETDTVPTITSLFNAVYYYLEHVFIIHSPDDYRLLVIHHNQVLLDKHYKSIRGAKIAFSRRFGHKVSEQFRYYTWSDIYPPDNDWLVGKLKLATMGN